MSVTLYEIKPGLWQVTHRRRKLMGGHYTTSKRVHGTKNDAKKMRALLIMRHNHEDAESNPREATLRAYLQAWIDRKEKSRQISEPTAEWYRRMAAYIYPLIGTVKLRDLTTDMVERALAELASQHHATTVLHVRSRINAALEDAVKEKYMKENVARHAKGPKRKHSDVDALTQEEMEHLLKVCKDHPLGTIVRFDLATGLRRGELCGLHWQDFDWEQGKVTVRRSAVQHGTLVTLKEPKSASGRRTITVPKNIMEEMRALHADRNNDTIVFSTRDGLRRKPAGLSAMINSYLNEVELGQYTLHSLRHTHATLLIRAKHPIKAVSERLGHSDIIVTLKTYAHVIPKDDVNLAAAFDALMSTGATPNAE